ncbi:competence protein CoiA family protein [Streptomyces nodosus]|uniref:competence protein CoiA family protein n=1 Tax=Streptomyces nodosus TaxID=40318 RepID=UPI0036DFEA59
MGYTAVHAEWGRLDASLEDLGCGRSWADVHRVGGLELACPECRGRVFARLSSHRARHFYHQVRPETCALANESPEHHLLKLELATAARAAGFRAELEVSSATRNWRADVLVFDQQDRPFMALEAQLSPMTAQDAALRSRPEKLYGTGPDNLWALSAAQQAVTELKTGCTTGTIAKKDMDQLGGSVRWFNDHNPEVKALPVMMHPSRVSDAKATAVPGMRVVTPELFKKLKEAVTSYAAALASSPDRWANEQAVREQLAYHKLTGDRFFTTYAEPVRPL